MKNKISWNSQKKELWKLNIDDLEKKLKEFKLMLMKTEMKARGFDGDLKIPMLKNRTANTIQSSVDIKGLRHKIACMHTMIKEKQNENII